MSCKNCNCNGNCGHIRCPHEHFLNFVSFTFVQDVSLTINVSPIQPQIGDMYIIRIGLKLDDATGNEDILINDGTNTYPVRFLCSGGDLKTGNLRRRTLLRMVFKNPGNTPATGYFTVHECQVCPLEIKPQTAAIAE